MSDHDFNPMSPSNDILTFDVFRQEDETGTSGLGVVAMGVIFPDGTTIVQWQTHVRSLVTYGSMADALYIHGHGDKTGFRFHNCPDRVYLSDGSFRVLGTVEQSLKPELTKSTSSPLCTCGMRDYAHTEASHV